MKADLNPALVSLGLVLHILVVFSKYRSGFCVVDLSYIWLLLLATSQVMVRKTSHVIGWEDHLRSYLYTVSSGCQTPLHPPIPNVIKSYENLLEV